MKTLASLACVGLFTAAYPAAADVSLYWTATDSTGAYVIRADGDGANPKPIVSGEANIKGPNGLEYYQGTLYWPDQQLNAVKQVKPDGTGLATVASAQNPYDVFADGAAAYWTSQERNYLDTVLLDGSGYRRVFASPDVTRPFAVEITPTHIYWSEVSGSGVIRRADRDGGNRITLIPNAYVYDFQVTANYIYFADNNYPGGIRRANLDGSNSVTLVPGGALFNGICVTDEAIYWSAFMDGDGGGIRRAKLDGSNQVNLYNAPPGTSIRGIAVVSDVATAIQPRFTGYRFGPKNVALTLDVEAGKPYRIESSANLGVWTEVGKFTSTSTSITVTNDATPGAGVLFLRARTP